MVELLTEANGGGRAGECHPPLSPTSTLRELDERINFQGLDEVRRDGFGERCHKATAIRNYVVQDLLNNQKVGRDPKFMEDVYESIQLGKRGYFDLIPGLKELANELEMTALDVRNSLTSSCFHKDFHDKRNPSNPYPFDEIFRAVADIYEGEHGTDEDVGGLEETDIDQGLAPSMSSVGIGGMGLGDNIASPFAPMASGDISGVGLGDSIKSPSALARSPFFSPSSARASRHFTPQGSRSSTHRRRQTATSGSKRSRDEIITNSSPKSAKRFHNPNYSETFRDNFGLMSSVMAKAREVASTGIHKVELSLDSGKEKIDETNPTPLARTLVTDRNGTTEKFEAFSNKTSGDVIGMMRMGDELGNEESHSSMKELENRVYSGTGQCKLAIKKNKDLIKRCDSIKNEAEHISELNVEEAASEEAKLLQEFKDLQAVQMEQFKADQAIALKLKAADLDKEKKFQISNINRIKDSVVRQVSLQKNHLQVAVEEQEEELKNSFTLERSWLKIVKTGFKGLKKALYVSAVAAEGHLAAVLNMQEAIESGDPERMKEDILDLEIR